MSDTFNLDALEVDGESGDPFTFETHGETFTMPLASAMPWQDQLALETATQKESLELILGAEQFARFQKVPMSSARLAALLKQWMEHQGLKPGE